jgi:hypothetical protein
MRETKGRGKEEMKCKGERRGGREAREEGGGEGSRERTERKQ